MKTPAGQLLLFKPKKQAKPTNPNPPTPPSPKGSRRGKVIQLPYILEMKAAA